MAVYLRGRCDKKHRHTAQCKTYYYDFCVRRKRYRGALPEAQTQAAAEEAERKERQRIFDQRYGEVETGTMTVRDFYETEYLPWAKVNKRSWMNDHYNRESIYQVMGDKQLRDVTPMDIHRLKSTLLNTKTKAGKDRALATVNRVFEFVSRMFSYAISIEKAGSNPCARVQKFKLDNERFRWLLPEEEAELLKVCTGRLKHLKPLIVISLATGLRKQELLKMKRSHVDMFRDLVIATKTKTGRNREIPMSIFSADARKALHEASRGKSGDAYLFVNKKTGKPYTDVKNGFTKACELAGIDGLVWHDLRATFGTRLAEMNYQSFLIRDLMGHTDLKTTDRYIRAAALKRLVRMHGEENACHNYVTRPVLAAS